MASVLFCLLLLFFGVHTSAAVSQNAPDNRVLLLHLKQDISLNDLIRVEGYQINDEDVVQFLVKFNELNPQIKSISGIKRGVSVRMPVNLLKRRESSSLLTESKMQPRMPKKSNLPKAIQAGRSDNADSKIDTPFLMSSMKKLFSSLGDEVTVEYNGFTYFPLSEKSDVSFDKSLFPIITLNNKNNLVVDYTGSFPLEIIDLVEVAWPEYRIISSQGKMGLRSLISVLLRASGYLFDENSRMISGGQSQVEYFTDFLVHGSNNTMSPEISLISVLDRNEFMTPPEVVSWFMKNDIRIIELAETEKKHFNKNQGQFIKIPENSTIKAFTESTLLLAGYQFSRDKKISLGNRKEIQYNLNADLMIDMGYKKKVIEFSGISDQDVQYIKKMGVDIAVIEPWEKRRDLLKKIFSLLSLNSSDNPKKNASILNPRKTRYRLFVPGFAVATVKGVFFMTDAEIASELTETIMKEGISIVKF